ncbi:DUF500-domain-containing protein [Aspergillus heteromorphus CBS 117.55]|uniref:DUF500-domain-containing protein n=1 Tax=Aspergillus heteromorphus CBS 117.55 TaxID=1448321 RepID=A0A317X1U9_9EURO|nr:DUF500-domain-containing protein [Aspergillus heteromorphus CBS 117.55]PWY92325.1 DUF500-domain-containing protein [Aspergillus heteromorphus CBS 117.55]
MPPFEMLKGMHSPLPGSLETECNKAAQILDTFTNPDRTDGPDSLIPPKILSSAKGFAIFSISKLGILGSIRLGSGILIARLPNNAWSAPSAIATVGIGIGGQIGVEIANFVLVLNTTSAVRTFAQMGSLSLGKNVSFAVGPSGRYGEVGGVISSGGVAGIFSYGQNRGLFGGFSTEGSVVYERRGANKKFYGRKVRVRELVGGCVDVPAEAGGLVDVLRGERFRMNVTEGIGKGEKGEDSVGVSELDAGDEAVKMPAELPAEMVAEMPVEFLAELPAEVVPDSFFLDRRGGEEVKRKPLPELAEEVPIKMQT